MVVIGGSSPSMTAACSDVVLENMASHRAGKASQGHCAADVEAEVFKASAVMLWKSCRCCNTLSKLDAAVLWKVSCIVVKSTLDTCSFALSCACPALTASSRVRSAGKAGGPKCSARGNLWIDDKCEGGVVLWFGLLERRSLHLQTCVEKYLKGSQRATLLNSVGVVLGVSHEL